MPTFRFAPSPNGPLHLGHAYSALLTWRLAKRLGGRVLLRIEDIDKARTREAFVEQIYADLAWLGLDWPRPVRRQSQHLADYARAARRLEELGVLYRCYASRGEIARAVAAASGGKGPQAPRDPDGAPLYPGRGRVLSAEEEARRRAAGAAFALRLDMTEALRVARERASQPLGFESFDEDGAVSFVRARPERWGDVVVVRKDVPTSYHLSVVVDDALQGVSHVTRGRDLLAATDVHCLLQVLLGLPTPRYHHHRLIRDDQGQKLSKSKGPQSLAALRKAGASPADIRALLGFN